MTGKVLAQRDAVVTRLPRVPVTELLIEVDRESGFSAHLTHAGGASPRHPELEHRRNLCAAIVSLACNFGSTRMAELTGIPADTIDWTIQWYLREETLRVANAAIVNAHHRHPLASALRAHTQRCPLSSPASSRRAVGDGVAGRLCPRSPRSTSMSACGAVRRPASRCQARSPARPGKPGHHESPIESIDGGTDLGQSLA